jgi:hypothetical protein
MAVCGGACPKNFCWRQDKPKRQPTNAFDLGNLLHQHLKATSTMKTKDLFADFRAVAGKNRFKEGFNRKGPTIGNWTKTSKREAVAA